MGISEALGAEELIKEMIVSIGDDPSREGLRATPARVARAHRELFSGYRQDPKDLFTFFDKGSYSGLVVLKDCEFFSHCEHHLLPFFGRAHVAYLPGEKIVGVSKLARLVDIYARRLQNQERLGEQVVDALMKFGHAKAAACIIEAQHLCMVARGVSKQHSTMVTASIAGAFRTDSMLRAELYSILGSPLPRV